MKSTNPDASPAKPLTTLQKIGVSFLIIGKALWLFLAAMAPLMFLVGVIAALDRWGTHNRLLQKLELYGRVADATIVYVSDGNGTAGLNFDGQGNINYGVLRLYYHYYPAEVIQSIHEGDTVRVIYIDSIVSEGGEAVLLEYYPKILQAPAIPADVWWGLGISWLVIAIQPQFVFLGLEHFDKLLSVEHLLK